MMLSRECKCISVSLIVRIVKCAFIPGCLFAFFHITMSLSCQTQNLMPKISLCNKLERGLMKNRRGNAEWIKLRPDARK